MSTLFLMIRHGATDVIGKRIMGRLPGVPINIEGREQAKLLTRVNAAAIISSPMERTIQTATPLAERLGLPIVVNEAFNEVDFGDWSGKTIDELVSMPEWKLFIHFRSGFRLPGGELMLEVQKRVVEGLASLKENYGENTVAVFSHGDVIKAAISHYVGAPLDLMDRINIDPGSVSRIELSDGGPKILTVNERFSS